MKTTLANLMVKRSIVQTLFVVMTGVALIVVMVMAAMISFSLEKGFKDHIQTTELSHLSAVEKTLVYYYQKTGNWNFLKAVGPDFARGMGELAQTVPNVTGQKPDASGAGVHDMEVLGLDPQGRQQREEQGPPRRRDDEWTVVPDQPAVAGPGPGVVENADTHQQFTPVVDESYGTPAPPAGTGQFMSAPDDVPAANPVSSTTEHSVFAQPQTSNRAGNEPPPPPPGPRDGGRNDLASIGQRMAVIDPDGKVVGGNPNPVMEPRRAIYITVDGQQKLIGYLALARPIVTGNIQAGGETGDANERFIHQQIRNILWISVLALIMSALAALLLARHFRQPIKELADGARQVAAGDFSIRLPVKRRDELGAVAQDFNQMAEQLGAFERSRRQWVADTSHELRTPITILSTHLEAMADGVIPSNPERLGVLAHTVADMNRLVGDLHQLASADAGARDYQFQPVEVGDLLADLELAFAARLQQQKLSLQVVDQTPGGLRIEADRLRLTQVLANLLTNSSRYTDAGGKVRIVATARAEKLTLVIEDSAPGVPPEALPKLFDRFYRVDASRSRKNGGSGLGLAICQAIIDAHHGVIVASASLLGGLRIEINLPLSRAGQVTA